MALKTPESNVAKNQNFILKIFFWCVSLFRKDEPDGRMGLGGFESELKGSAKRLSIVKQEIALLEKEREFLEEDIQLLKAFLKKRNSGK